MSIEADTTLGDGDMPVQLPYGAEYAKTGRAGCKGCKTSIPKDALRMSVRFPSPFFDGYQDNWHHFECFWKKARKNDINEVSIKGFEWLKWEDQEAIRQRIADLKEMPDDYNVPKSAIPKVERSKTSSAKCIQCKEKMHKNELRIAYKAGFYHLLCYVQSDGPKKPAGEFSGYELLTDEEKALINLNFSSFEVKNEESQKRKADENAENNVSKSLRPKRSKTVFGEVPEIRKKMKEQTDLLWNAMEKFRDNLTKEEIEEILTDNGVYKRKKDSVETRIELLADYAVFGAPAACIECSNGVLRFSNSIKSYQCNGNISEFTRCAYTNKNPKRHSLKIAKHLAEKHPWLKTYRKPLLPARTYPEAAETEGIIVKSSLLNKYNKQADKPKSESISRSSRMIVKNGCTVDPDCEKAAVTHVYIDPVDKKPWQVTLGATDVQTGRNSFYKLQLLQHDRKNSFYLFRAWGRIGTKSGGSKTENFGDNIDGAKEAFCTMFNEKTRNNWEDRDNFQKHPFGMNIVEMELDGTQNANQPRPSIDPAKSTSKLPDAIKRLLALIFDIDKMNKTMMEFEINLDEMPLGKLSRKHLLSAYQVLTDIQAILESGGEPQTLRRQCVDASNRFYTLIPHNTGMRAPQTLNNLELIKKKTEMLDNLLELHVAYTIIKSEEEIKDEKDIVDMHYEKLNCKLEVVERDSREFSLIEKYINNTHADTHGHYRLELVDILKVDREEDSKRFRADIGNRHLLWHGSRTSNFVGILSHGLRIAPPEAPSSGYMFGKGIYMADMVSKSANYCATSTEGLLLLCDAALGEIRELKHAKDARRLPKGKSSVKGIGGTMPNPKEAEMFDGMKVPCGKPIRNNADDLSLLYNEYIVYDEAQIRMRYLIRAKWIFNVVF